MVGSSASQAEWVWDSVSFQTRNTSEGDGCSILDSFANYTLGAETPDVISRCSSNFPLETFFAFHDAILGKFMNEINSTANADRELWTDINNTQNGAQKEAQACSRKTRYTRSKKLLLKTQDSTPF